MTTYRYRVFAFNAGGDSTPSDVAEATTQAAGSITLSATGYVKGRQKVDLTWSGAASSSVDVYRNNVLTVTTANDGKHTDTINVKGGGSYIYRVCEAGSSTCSNNVTVSF